MLTWALPRWLCGTDACCLPVCAQEPGRRNSNQHSMEILTDRCVSSAYLTHEKRTASPPPPPAAPACSSLSSAPRPRCRGATQPLRGCLVHVVRGVHRAAALASMRDPDRPFRAPCRRRRHRKTRGIKLRWTLCRGTDACIRHVRPSKKSTPTHDYVKG